MDIKKVRTTKMVGWLFLVFIFMLTLVPSSASQTADAGMEKLIEGAKKEGEVIYYASMNLEEIMALIPKFEKKYPFLKVKLVRTGGESLLNRLVSEYRAKKYLADVIQTLAFNMDTLRRGGILGQYLSSEDRFFQKGFKEQGYWICSYCNTYVIAYNTKLVPRHHVPKTYEDLLTSRWKGKMMMDATKVDWFAGMLQIMGKEKGLKFMRDLSRQDISLRIGHALLAQLLTAGEGDLVIDIPTSSVERLKDKGAPIDWMALGPIPGVMIGIGIASHPPHPNAARLFADFVVSKEGQTSLRDFGRNVVRSDIAQPAEYRGLTIVPVDPSLASHMNEYTELLRGIFSK